MTPMHGENLLKKQTTCKNYCNLESKNLSMHWRHHGMNSRQRSSEVLSLHFQVIGWKLGIAWSKYNSPMGNCVNNLQHFFKLTIVSRRQTLWLTSLNGHVTVSINGIGQFKSILYSYLSKHGVLSLAYTLSLTLSYATNIQVCHSMSKYHSSCSSLTLKNYFY